MADWVPKTMHYEARSVQLQALSEWSLLKIGGKFRGAHRQDHPQVRFAAGVSMKSGILFAGAMLLALGVDMSVSIAHAAGDAKAGQTKSAVCAACHGMDGNSNSPEWPSLAGQHESYVVKQLKAFKSGQRNNPLMTPQAQVLTIKIWKMWQLIFLRRKSKAAKQRHLKLLRGSRSIKAV